MKTEREAWLSIAHAFTLPRGAGTPYGLCSAVTILYVTGEISLLANHRMQRKISLFDSHVVDNFGGYFWFTNRRGNRHRVIAACLCAAMCEPQ